MVARFISAIPIGRLRNYTKIQWAQSPWQININSDKNITQWLLFSCQTIVCCSVGCKYRYTRCNAYWNTHIFLRLWTREHVSAILCPKICFYILTSTITHFLDRSNITKLVKHYNKVSYFPLKSNCFLVLSGYFVFKTTTEQQLIISHSEVDEWTEDEC